ncbi:M48 family metallopeptidase [Pseudorhodobacter ferrugineus]|uniref:M48 family metallopeptidase n=1 Tax=Pseudorhodobacter ferrugineus TaxID=77008 RepID=UPI0003B3431C|nr:M48 family metallopeptidase [Pseudorhodobacter ferrugineus]
MIGAAPIAATFFDGQTAQRHPVLVSVTSDGSGLILDLQTGVAPWLWPLTRLRALGDQAVVNALTLTLQSDSDDESPRDPARLVITDPDLMAWVRLSAPQLAKRDVRRGTATKIITRLALAVASIGVIVFVILPRMSDFLADRMPLETEVKFGRAVVSQMKYLLGAGKSGTLACNNPAGEAALNRMASRLMDGQELKYAISFSVLDHEMVNAFAAPGGQIIILRGLLDTSDTAEEVAAVLAHEIGHVEARDPTRLMLRAAGSAGIVSIVLGDVTGGSVIGIIGDQMLQTSYTRKAEAAADEFGLAMLQAAKVDSAAFADFFDKLSGLEDGFVPPEYLSSHPSTSARAARARDFAAAQTGTTPILTDAEWQALKGICKG